MVGIPQWPLAAARLFNLPPDRLWFIRLVALLLSDTGQPRLQTPRLDFPETLSIHPRSAVIRSHPFVGMGQNILAINLVVEHVEAVSRLVLRLAIQLDLKFPDLTRCCQTHRQSPLLPSFTNTPEVRALSSAGITRPRRSYGPLRLPDWPPPFLATFGAATPSQSRASLTDPDRLLCMPCSIPRWTGSGARWLASCAFPRGFLPCPCCLPRCRGGSAST